MALITFNPTPGLNKDDTPLAAEGGYVDGDKIRFREGRPEVMGGWEAVTSDTFSGIARGRHAWVDLTGRRYAAWGTATSLYALVGGGIVDITPPHSEGVLTNPFTTATGSAVVRVTHADHAFKSGMIVTFANQSATVGGLTLSGAYTVTVLDADTYTVIAGSNAGSTTTGGGNVDYSAVLPAGLVDGLGEPGGYGTGTYGTGGYGETIVTDILPRVWFLDGWGETLVAVPRDGGLYQWQPATIYPNLVTNGDFASSVGWTAGAGWAFSGAANALAGTGSDLSSAVAFRDGYVYRVSATVAASAGTLSIRTDGGALGDASAAISVSGVYSRLFRVPAGSAAIVFRKDAAFVGSVDNVSVTLESIAYRVDEAPTRNAAMFVDPHQIVVLMGTSRESDVYNPLAIRWSDLEDITDWTSTVANLAGDAILANGGRIIGGLATRQQNLLWTDVGLTTMQFTGSAVQPYLFNLVGTGCGLLGAQAAVEQNGVVYWASRSQQFFIFNGAVPTPIPCKIKNDFFANLSVNQAEKVACGVMQEFSEVWFLTPDQRDGNECSRYAAYRWDENHWTSGTHARSAFISAGIFDYPILFGTDGRLYYHEKGSTANGGALSFFLDSAYSDIGDGDNLMMVRRVVGDFENFAGYVDFIFTGRRRPTAPETVYPALQHMPTTEKLDCRITARQVKLRLTAMAAPLSARLGAVRLDVLQLGSKR